MSGLNNRTPACVWKVSSELLVKLQEHLGSPIDSYVNGSQVWLREDGPSEMTLEWRLHPVASYVKPPQVETAEVFSTTAFAIANNETPPAPPESLWGGLECFAAFGDEIEPAILKAHAEAVLPLAADAFGMVDHASAGSAWEKSRGAVSLFDLLMNDLSA